MTKKNDLRRLADAAGRQALALERIANALEKSIGAPKSSPRQHPGDVAALYLIREEYVDQAGSWDDFLRQLSDQRCPTITSDDVARRTRMSKRRVYRALQHTGSLDWQTGERLHQ